MTEDLIEAGYVVKTHGVKGQLRINFNENIKELSPGEALFFSMKGAKLPFFISAIEYIGEHEAFVQFEELTNKEDAFLYTKKMIWCALSHSFPEEQVSTTYDGFDIYDEVAGYIGKIISETDMFEYSLVEVEHEGKKVMIPLHEDLIISLDPEKKSIHLRLPNGLLDHAENS